MCQLLGMNCNTPTDIGFSFAGFRQRGGATDHHETALALRFLKKTPMAKSGYDCSTMTSRPTCRLSPIW